MYMHKDGEKFRLLCMSATCGEIDNKFYFDFMNIRQSICFEGVILSNYAIYSLSNYLHINTDVAMRGYACTLCPFMSFVPV